MMGRPRFDPVSLRVRLKLGLPAPASVRALGWLGIGPRNGDRFRGGRTPGPKVALTLYARHSTPTPVEDEAG